MAVLQVTSNIGFDMSGGMVPEGSNAQVLTRTSTEYSFSYVDSDGDPCVELVQGFGFLYDSTGDLAGGTITAEGWGVGGQVAYTLVGLDVDVATLMATPDAAAELAYIFRGDDRLVGNIHEDLLIGAGGRDTILAGAGDDGLTGDGGDDYLRGDEGNDVIYGGAGFDDINGNMGNDTESGGLGDDWVVGGRDNDNLSGDTGGDVVWGNLGNDTCSGDDGFDQVRGGQGDDSVSGGAGDDFVSGDRGNDTISGGAGADLFHGSQDAGIDRVLDFHRSEGDRVMLDPGTTYTVGQVGADTIVDMGGGHQMILVGVQLSTLTPGWIFGAS